MSEDCGGRKEWTRTFYDALTPSTSTAPAHVPSQLASCSSAPGGSPEAQMDSLDTRSGQVEYMNSVLEYTQDL